MTDEDLHALHDFLLDMGADDPIRIGPFHCHAIELFVVAREAVTYRAMIAKAQSAKREDDQ